jgi:threonine/homoserine/homoserine lactone efflux protein
MVSHLGTFLAVSAVVIVTPGPDTALTMRNTLFGGRGRGVLTAIGVSTGQATWALSAAVGITALIRSAQPVFTAIRLAGALYLIFLTSLLPQFAAPDAPAFVSLVSLGVAFSLMTLVWLTTYALVVARTQEFLRRPGVRRTLEILTGAALVGLALHIIWEQA